MSNDPEYNSRSPMSSLGYWGTVIVTGIVIITCIVEAIYGQEGAPYNFFMFIFNVIGTLLAFFQLFRPQFKPSSRPPFSSSSLTTLLTKSVRPAWYVIMSLLMVVSLAKLFGFPLKPNPS